MLFRSRSRRNSGEQFTHFCIRDLDRIFTVEITPIIKRRFPDVIPSTTRLPSASKKASMVTLMFSVCIWNRMRSHEVNTAVKSWDFLFQGRRKIAVLCPTSMLKAVTSKA